MPISLIFLISIWLWMLLPCTMSRICKHCAVGRQLISDIWFTSKKAQKTILLLEQISKKSLCITTKFIVFIQNWYKVVPKPKFWKLLSSTKNISHEINSNLTKEKEPADSQVIWKRVFFCRKPQNRAPTLRRRTNPSSLPMLWL